MGETRPETGPEQIPKTEADSASPAPAGEASADQEWRAHPGPGPLIGFVAAITCGLLAFMSSVVTLTQTGPAFFMGGIFTLLLALICGTTLFLALVAFRLSYVLTDDSLVVCVSGLGWTVPYHHISHVVYQPGDPVPHAGWERFWPGLRLGELRTQEGIWRSAATTRPRDRVRVYCNDGSITAISPWRPIPFVHELEARIARVHDRNFAGDMLSQHPSAVPINQLQPHQTDIASELERRIPALHLFHAGLLRDRLTSNAIALSLTLIICMALFTVYRVDGVIQPLPARWNAAGEGQLWLRPDGPWVFAGIWFYAALGLCLLVTNMAVSTFLLLIDHHLARLVILATPAIELVVLIALLRGTL